MTGTTLFHHRYELRKQLGENADVALWRAFDSFGCKLVMLAIYPAQETLAPGVADRILREVQILAKLSQQHLAGIIEYGTEAGHPFLVADDAEGSDLARYIRRWPAPHRRTTADHQQLAEIASQICEAIGLIHRAGLVHGAIRPDNIRIMPDGLVKIAGLHAGRLPPASPTKQSPTADWLYASPEQAAGQALTPAADVYALGAVLFEMFTGRPPFSGRDPLTLARKHEIEPPPIPGNLNPAIPRGLEEIILRALAKTPADRFRNGEQMARVLRAYIAEDAAEEDMYEEGIDWRIVGLIFGNIIAWGGLIPLWIYAYFLYNPPSG
jgi:eukaryotic-like serine/threonine-protein kinase